MGAACTECNGTATNGEEPVFCTKCNPKVVVEVKPEVVIEAVKDRVEAKVEDVKGKVENVEDVFKHKA